MKQMKYKSTSRSKRVKIAQTTAQIKDVMDKVPVLIGLKDGSVYYGFIRDLQGQDILFEGVKGNKPPRRSSSKGKANISSLGGLGGLAGLFGNSGSGGSGGLGGLGGLLGGLGGSGGGGLFGNLGGFMKIGMGMLKFIMPLMSGFGI
ncbi:hypothetical protein A8709_18700 [Paenibacillus pectinilyticus]|uniref:Uncharacterized protein n=1 Tax=Paenibacillus pectinilyticus TaxID=512399 RepID=A0A1C0ZZT4_9BACL|nr:hypothetical protein [Paenibacillus pectinilyticus]OCT13620.1 hypothetical protein A8709_18700 [Paenibacillus pectinilyticus]